MTRLGHRQVSAKPREVSTAFVHNVLRVLARGVQPNITNAVGSLGPSRRWWQCNPRHLVRVYQQLLGGAVPGELRHEPRRVDASDKLNDSGKDESRVANHGVNVQLLHRGRVDGWNEVEDIPDPIHGVETGKANSGPKKSVATLAVFEQDDFIFIQGRRRRRRK